MKAKQQKGTWKNSKEKSADWRKDKRGVKGNGSVKIFDDGRIYARLQYVGEDGKRKDKLPRADSKSHARELLREMFDELNNHGESMLEADKMTFSDVADKFEKYKLFEAEYHGERKIAGMRNWQDPKRWLETLKKHFGHKRVRSITHADIAAYKRKKLNETITRKKKIRDENDKVKVIETVKPRALASVNRELELMRGVMRFAKRQKWILSSPFEEGEPLISKSDETRRERVLSFDEEKRLLEWCGDRIITYDRKDKKVKAFDSGEKRIYLRAIIITALDTAMRRGELFKLQWKDVDFVTQTITVRAMNSKTARPRTIAMTPRVLSELTMLWNISTKDLQGLVFGITNTIKSGWLNLLQYAKIDGLNFHDLRHTSITRMVQAGITAHEVMRISGHTQPITFLRYVNPNTDAIKRAADVLSQFNAMQDSMLTVQSNGLVN